MSFGALLQRIQKGLSVVELVHTSHPRWPLPPAPSFSHALQISVLDSSFNPPTLAHLALANIVPQHPATTHLAAHVESDFDARLLLLSVRNVDKQLKPGDATYEQRMEMMVLFAQDLAHAHSPSVLVPDPATQPSPSHEVAHPNPNVAVAIIDEPTFVGKSAILLDFLQKRISELELHSSSPSIITSPQTASLPSPKLTFLMGTDTIVRLFASRYYADEHAMTTALYRFLSPVENDSRIICARRIDRGVTKADAAAMEVQLPDLILGVAPSDRIAFVDIGDEECTYSSSEVRHRIANRDEGWKSMVTSNMANYIAGQGLYTVAP